MAEVIALVGIGLVLLLAFREQDLSLLGETLGAEALSGGSVRAALLAALAVGGWVFIGFDACVGSAEETRGAGPASAALGVARAPAWRPSCCSTPWPACWPIPTRAPW